MSASRYKGHEYLFSDEEWANMRRAGLSATNFGKQFLQYIKDYNRKHGTIAEILPKLSDNKQPYRKVTHPPDRVRERA